MSINYLKATITGKCSHCGCNCWKEHDGKPAFLPCGIAACPYYDEKTVVKFERSSTGSSILQITDQS